MSGKSDPSADFTSFYLERATKEFAEDLNKVRSADDFKGDALPMLISSLQQGTALFSPADQQRIADARKKDTQPQEASSSSSEMEK